MMKYKSGIILRQNQATYLDIIFLIETIKVIRSHYSTAERTQNLKSGILSYNFDFAIFYLCDIRQSILPLLISCKCVSV